MLRDFVNVARDTWREPDHGIWEIRSNRRHHTVSKAMCWVAMERGLRLEREGVLQLDRASVERERDAARRTIREQAFNAELNSYAATLGGDSVDASLLLLSLYGFEDPDSQRMNATIDRVYERLGTNGALFRYRETDDGIEGPEEGRFGICGFWGVEALATAGRIDEARRAFDQLMDHANDVGLFAEEIDLAEARALGNFPQALTHVGVINAARTLDAAERGVSARAEAGATP
jgi:GH15 family glucan-1,4-alpha-glucosidase